MKTLISNTEKEMTEDKPRDTEGKFTSKPRSKSKLAASFFLFLVLVYVFNSYNTWTHTWSMKFQFPIRISNHDHIFNTIMWQNIFDINPVAQENVSKSSESEIEKISKQLFPVAKAAEVNPETLGTEDYIRYVFGKDARMALAISHAENGTRQCDRFGINTNKTIDFGVFQINTIHTKRFPISQLISCHGNVDAAKIIFDEQGWGPWVAFMNGSYKKSLPLF